MDTNIKSNRQFKRGVFSLLTFAVVVTAVVISIPSRVDAQYNWGTLLSSSNSAAWYGQSAQTAVADDILANQLSNGGWRKDNATTSGEWAKATTDNDATTSHIRFLARVFKATNTAKYRTGCERGIDLLINGQYANGGWPQIFGASSGTYHAHITYNDGAMVKVLNIMKEVAERSGDFTFIDNARAQAAKVAMDRGVECILNTQITFTNGKVTAWCQQHHSVTLAPAAGRAYELPSVSGSESVGIVNFLKSYQTSLGSGARRDIALAINNAITWLDEVKIVGKRVENITTNGSADRRVVDDPSSTIWARFYELNTGRPIFVGRDGVIKYSLAEIEQERRAGYAYYGNWPRTLINAGLVQVPGHTSLNGSRVKTPAADGQSGPASMNINITVANGGRTLNISSPDNDALTIRVIDTRGKVRAKFNAGAAVPGSSRSFSLATIPAGRYFVDARGAGGVRRTSAIIVK